MCVCNSWTACTTDVVRQRGAGGWKACVLALGHGQFTINVEIGCIHLGKGVNNSLPASHAVAGFCKIMHGVSDPASRHIKNSYLGAAWQRRKNTSIGI